MYRIYYMISEQIEYQEFTDKGAARAFERWLLNDIGAKVLRVVIDESITTIN